MQAELVPEHPPPPSFVHNSLIHTPGCHDRRQKVTVIFICGIHAPPVCKQSGPGMCLHGQNVLQKDSPRFG
jgi:hypothetical protein